MIDSEIEVNLILALNEQNPWWIQGTPPKKLAKRFRREDFYHIKKELEKKEIIAIIGQRQVGKTTMLYQLSDYLINEKNTNPKNILYFSFDNPYASIAQHKSENLITLCHSCHSKTNSNREYWQNYFKEKRECPR